MNAKLFFSTFLVIFLAELGDKTQLAVLTRAASASARWTVFAGASAALVVSTLVAILAGSALAKVVPERVLKLGAGVLFLVLGALVLWEARRPAAAPAASAAPAEAIGPLGRFLLARAAEFERAAFEDYRKLAERAQDPAVRSLLLALASEEEEHFRHIGELDQAHGGVVLSGGAEQGLPAAPEVLHDVAASADRPILEHAIEHEEATAGFYRQLAASTTLPALRNALQTLAEAESGHAARLRALQGGESARA